MLEDNEMRDLLVFIMDYNKIYNYNTENLKQYVKNYSHKIEHKKHHNYKQFNTDNEINTTYTFYISEEGENALVSLPCFEIKVFEGFDGMGDFYSDMTVLQNKFTEEKFITFDFKEIFYETLQQTIKRHCRMDNEFRKYLRFNKNGTLPNDNVKTKVIYTSGVQYAIDKTNAGIMTFNTLYNDNPEKTKEQIDLIRKLKFEQLDMDFLSVGNSNIDFKDIPASFHQTNFYKEMIPSIKGYEDIIFGNDIIFFLIYMRFICYTDFNDKEIFCARYNDIPLLTMLNQLEDFLIFYEKIDLNKRLKEKMVGSRKNKTNKI